MSKKGKAKRHKLHHRVLGKVKVADISHIQALGVVQPPDFTSAIEGSAEETNALAEPEHIVVAVPKSAWDKFCAWFNGDDL